MTAESKTTGADLVIRSLIDQDVDVVFGYPGGAVLPIYDSLFKQNRLRHILVRHEQAAVHAAEGYARSTGKVGVVLVTSGPGATNAVTGLTDALMDSIPVVCLTGQVPTHLIGNDAFQEADTTGITRPCTKHNYLVKNAADLQRLIGEAFYVAKSGRPGPVVIDLPKDVQNWQGTFRGEGLLPVPGYRQRLHAARDNVLSEKKCAKFFGMLQASKRPLIYAGGGVINGDATDELRAFAGHFGVPVTTTLMGIGAVDTTEPLSLHMLGMHGLASANYAVEDCDFLIAVGARFDDRVAGVPGRFAPRARNIAQFDIDPSEIGKVKPVQWAHVGVLKQDLRALLEYGKRHRIEPDFGAWHAEIADLKRTYALNFDRASELIQPYAVIEAINAIAGGDAIISTGVGQHQMWAAQYFDYKFPRLWLTSGSMGTMGFGLPAAIGAQFAKPDHLVIDVDGDASIRMNIGELETVTTYGLPVKVLVLNNFGDGMVKQWQKLYYKGRLSASDKSLRKKDFIKAAEADGFEYAVRLDRKADLARVVAEWLAFPGPAFLEVIIDPDAGVYPMVGPGLSYDQMITGDFIPNRKQVREDDIDGSSMF
jgi:acetolactate synthase-1/2/3 large subunit